MPTWTKDDLRHYEMKTAKQHNAPLVGIAKVLSGPGIKAPTFFPRHVTEKRKLNKLEKSFLAHLQCMGFPGIHVQAITLKLGDDCRYTPDFSYVDCNGRMVLAEVKGGFFRDDAKVKLKTAARQFPEFTFTLVTKSLSAGWEFEEIKP